MNDVKTVTQSLGIFLDVGAADDRAGSSPREHGGIGLRGSLSKGKTRMSTIAKAVDSLDLPVEGAVFTSTRP
ncbi:hypothetical protein, partial [Streptomyces anandii]|uniref:hypothetical protein n=1 Tax=Streptomyces anandii TaxID=285454 RepID=UPI001E312D0F